MAGETHPLKGTPEYEQWGKEWLKKRTQELLSADCDFDQVGLLSGGKRAMRDENPDGKPDLKVVK
ncbi:hypothetical protein ACJJIW_09995 [Microbulbifer sp. JMSA004]|uniref:hypothetical protein n=1 Tax=Microbulbifer sp. JMSA004 TaxID=3243370 RepID=UPI00403981E3